MHTELFPNHRSHARNILEDTCTHADQPDHIFLPASQLCSNIYRRRRHREHCTMDPDSQLEMIIMLSKYSFRYFTSFYPISFPHILPYCSADYHFMLLFFHYYLLSHSFRSYHAHISIHSILLSIRFSRLLPELQFWISSWCSNSLLWRVVRSCNTCKLLY